MYTAYIGKRFIECLNQRDGTNYTPRTFFDEVYFRLFFDEERFLLNANNSPVDQAYKNKGKTPLTTEVLELQRARIHQKIEGGDSDASIFLGGPSLDRTASTSGQVTNIPRVPPSDEIYASWLGASLGIGVEGGYSLLIDAPDVLLALYEGWTQYRTLLEQTPSLKAMQINTWNGQWLTVRFAKQWNPSILHSWQTDKDGGALTTQTWIQLLFSVAHHYTRQPDQTLVAYIYALGQTNRTIGFVRLSLPKVRYLVDLYPSLFDIPIGLPAAAFETLYETELGFKRACQFAEIGLKALQPKDMRSYMEGNKSPTYPDKDPHKQLHFQTQQTWIIAMLNNREFITRTEEIARALHGFAQRGGRGKSDYARKTDDVLESKTRREFIENLTTILKSDETDGDLFNGAVEEITVMPTENVPLFLTLLRFKYAYINRKVGPKTE